MLTIQLIEQIESEGYKIDKNSLNTTEDFLSDEKGFEFKQNDIQYVGKLDREGNVVKGSIVQA